MARPYLYSASLPLPVVAAARRALRLITAQPELREALWRNAEALHSGLAALGLLLQAPAGPVGSIRLPGYLAGYRFWQALLARGVYVNILVPPATPEGEVVLRFSVSAAHRQQHIETALAAFREAMRETGLS